MPDGHPEHLAARSAGRRRQDLGQGRLAGAVLAQDERGPRRAARVEGDVAARRGRRRYALVLLCFARSARSGRQGPRRSCRWGPRGRARQRGSPRPWRPTIQRGRRARGQLGDAVATRRSARLWKLAVGRTAPRRIETGTEAAGAGGGPGLEDSPICFGRRRPAAAASCGSRPRSRATGRPRPRARRPSIMRLAIVVLGQDELDELAARREQGEPEACGPRRAAEPRRDRPGGCRARATGASLAGATAKCVSGRCRQLSVTMNLNRRSSSARP